MNASHDDGYPADDTSLDDFAERLRTIGDRIPLGSDESGLIDVNRLRQARRRRQRAIPVAAAAAVGIAAITGALVATNLRNDTLTVSSQPVSGTDVTPTDPPEIDATATTASESSGRTTTPPPTPTNGPPPSETSTGITTVLVDPTVGDRQRPQIIDTDAEDVTDLVPRADQTRPEGIPDDVEYDTSFEWLVEWNGGFLLGRESFDLAGELDVRFSPDGRSWDTIEVTPPDGWGSVDDVESTGDRLLVLTTRWVDGSSLPTLWSTVNLVDWDSWAIPSDDPTAGFPASLPALGGTRGVEVVANGAAWAVQVRGDIDIDTFVLAEQYVDGQIDSVGSALDGQTLTLDIGVGEDETSVEIDLSADIGLDIDQLGALQIGAYNEMWIGDWTDSAPAQVTELPPGSFGGLAASDDSLAGWTTTHVGVIANGSTTMRVVAARPEVAARSSIIEVYADGNDFVIHSSAPSAEASFDQLDTRSGEWTPLDLSPLPSTVRVDFGADDDAAVMSPQSLPGSVATIGSVDVGEYRYTTIYDPPFSTYELRGVDDGDLVLAETIDIRVGSDPRADGWRFQIFDPAEDRVVDPGTGEVLVDLTDQQAAELYSSRMTFDGEPAPNFTLEDFTPRDLWVASVADGSWLLHDLPEPTLDENGNPRRSPYGLIERSGDVLLVETGDGWLRFDVGR